MRAYYLANSDKLKKCATERYLKIKGTPEHRKRSNEASIRFYKKLRSTDERRKEFNRKCAIRSARWYQKKKQDAEWVKKLREKCNARNRANYAKNPFPILIFSDARRARQRNAKGSHTVEQWKSRICFYGSRCFYCKKELGKGTLTKEHRIPLSMGGSNFSSNLVPACRSCNSIAYQRRARKIP